MPALSRISSGLLRVFLSCIFIHTGLLWAQQPVSTESTPGLTGVKYFGKTDFRSDEQFWAMAEGPDGTLYFGNNHGVVIWDGERWTTLTLPNYSSVRSLVVTAGGAIWAGGYNEVGVIKRDGTGNYFYESRSDLLGLNVTDKANIWHMIPHGEDLVLRFDQELVVVRDNVAAHIKPRNFILYAEKVNDMVLVHDLHHGIFRLNMESLEMELVCRADQLREEAVKAIFPGEAENEVTLITKEGGVYKADLIKGGVERSYSIFNSTEEDQVNAGVSGPEGNIILGTQGSKLIEISANGEVNRNYYLNSQIKSRTVENLRTDAEGNIWVLTNQGLNFIDFDAPYSQMLNDIPILDALQKDGQLYVATNQGVYILPDDTSVSGQEVKLDNLPGQAWSLNVVGDEILVGHNDGLFRVNGARAERLGPEAGFWGVVPVPEYDNIFLATNYSGLYLLKIVNGRVENQGMVAGFDDSTRDIAPSLTEPYTFWICHGYKGVYRLKFSRDYTRVVSTEFFTTYNGLESPFNILVREFDGNTIFTTNTGIYTFNDAKHRFEPHDELNAIFDPKDNTSFLEKAFDKTWFVSDGSMGYYRNDDREHDMITLPFSHLKNTFVGSMECLLPVSKDLVYVGTNDGLFLFNTAIREGISSGAPPTLISHASLTQKGEIKPLNIAPKHPEVIANHRSNSLTFAYTNPQFASRAEVYYSYMLEGRDKGWSAWTPKSEVSFNGLTTGEYTFRVKSKSAAGELGEETSYIFSLSPAWYESWWWYLTVAAFLSVLAIGLRLLIVKKIRYERKVAEEKVMRSQKMMQLEMEKYKLTLQQDKMEQEKEFLVHDVIEKSKELANYTLLLSKRKELFNDIYEDLKTLRRQVKKQSSKEALKGIFNKLENNRIGEKYLEIFDVNFERVHHDFFERLRAVNSGLTKREEQMCALIKMDLSNKEIAPILNLSLRGVETARYRLRKKLGIDSSDSLREFLDHFEHPVAEGQDTLNGSGNE